MQRCILNKDGKVIQTFTHTYVHARANERTNSTLTHRNTGLPMWRCKTEVLQLNQKERRIRRRWRGKKTNQTINSCARSGIHRSRNVIAFGYYKTAPTTRQATVLNIVRHILFFFYFFNKIDLLCNIKWNAHSAWRTEIDPWNEFISISIHRYCTSRV